MIWCTVLKMQPVKVYCIQIVIRWERNFRYLSFNWKCILFSIFICCVFLFQLTYFNWDEKCLKNDVRFSPQSQFLFVNNFFCLSSNLFLEIQSISITSIEFHQLLSIITNYFYYIYRCQSNQKNKSKKFFENQKNNNCRLKLSLFYPNILSIVIYVTTYYNILTNWNKKNWDQFSAQKLHCLLLFTFITLMVNKDLVSKFRLMLRRVAWCNKSKCYETNNFYFQIGCTLIFQYDIHQNALKNEYSWDYYPD